MRLFDLPPILATLVLSSNLATAFYLPGITPTTYRTGDTVPLYVNRLTPSVNDAHRQLSSAFAFNYYHESFHFCMPEEGLQSIREGLGSILFGDRILNSPYVLRMRQNETCRAVCDGDTIPPEDAIFVNRRIRQSYIMNWLVDGLPAAQRFLNGYTGLPFYKPGFALGRVVGDRPQLHNHYDIFIEYHRVENEQYRVVGVEVEPSSREGSRRTGTGQDMTADCGSISDPLVLSEEVENPVTWTYSVYWRPSSTTFATRWDKLLQVSRPSIHWIALIICAGMFMFLTSIVSTILTRTLRKDITRYNRLDQLGLDDLNGTSLEEDGVVEDSGWKLVHGDVFRPPRNSLALSVLIGNGAQLFSMTTVTIAFAAIGFLSPSNRGSLASVMIMLYSLFAFIGGYTAARIYKSFSGKSWKQLFIYTPSAVPLVVFTTFFILNFFLWIRRSSGAVPFTTMLVIVGIWFLISAPLSIAGSWIGFKQTQSEPPVRTNQIPRQIPPSTGYLRVVPQMLVVGILPFFSIFIELYFVTQSLWTNRIYYMFGFLFLSFGLLIITTAVVTIIAVYFLLCNENYHWQWRAFATSGASAVYVFAYCMVYWARMLNFSSVTGGLLYLGYSLLMAGLCFVMTGTIGFFACWLFVWRIYRSLKLD